MPAGQAHAPHSSALPLPTVHKAAAPAHMETHTAAPKPKPKLAPLAPAKTPMHGSGQPLAPHIQEAIQNSLLVDLSSVRLHASTAAQRKAQSLSARAFTFGSDIFLGHGEHPTDLTLISHEAAHVIQQQHTAPVMQAWSSQRSDPFEREADRAAAAVSSGQNFTVRERTAAPMVQRLGISDALDYIANAAYNIPGFRMFSIVLGVNPVNMEHVDRSPANIMRAVVEFIPGGAQISKALDKYGVFDKVGGWVSEQIDTLGLIGSSIKKALMNFLDSLSWTDIFHLGDVWDRAKRIFTDPIDRIKNFVVGLIEGIWKFVREVLLKPIALLAQGTAGWDLLVAVMGENPITGEKVPTTPGALIGGFMKLIHEEEVWQNIKKANAISRAFAWFKSVISELLGFVAQIPGLFVKALKTLDWSDILDLPGGFMKIAGVFGKFLVSFISWAGDKVWTLLKIIFEAVAPAVVPYLLKVGAAFKNILKNPLAFVHHLIDAGILGLQNFVKNFGEHLKKALIDWLVGALPGVYIPKAFTLMEFGKFALSVLGISWAQIRAKIVKALGPNGETIMKGLETAFDVVMALIHGGPAAAWELIKDKLTNLKDMLIDGIVGFVTDTIIKKAIPKLISLFIPGAGFISAIVSIYDSIMVFVQKLAKIAAAVKAFVDSIVAISAGQIAAAAAKVESGLEGMLSIAISFLAGFLGLGNIASKILEVIKKVQAVVDKGLDTAINWVVTKAKSLFAKLFGGKKEEKDDRTPEQKQRDLGLAVAAANVLIKNKELSIKDVNAQLGAIKKQYKLTVLETRKESETESGENDFVYAEINPSDKTETINRVTRFVPPVEETFICSDSHVKDGLRGEFDTQVKDQETGLNAMLLQNWERNVTAYAERKAATATADQSGSGRDPKGAEAQQTARDDYRKKRIAEEVNNDKSNRSKEEKTAAAEIKVDQEMKGLAALHDPDQIAGGDPTNIKRLGSRRVNSSIGSQWRSKAKEFISKIRSRVVGIANETLKILQLNVRLNPK